MSRWHKKTAPFGAVRRSAGLSGGPCQGRLALALARLEAGVLLIDDVNPALAADDAAAFFAQLGGFQRVSDLHRSRSHFSKRPRSGVEARKLGEEDGVVNADQRLIRPTSRLHRAGRHHR